MVNDAQADGIREEGSDTNDRGASNRQGIGKQARKRIGTHLRAMYDSLAQQPVPSRFTDLIAQLDDTATDKAVVETAPGSA